MGKAAIAGTNLVRNVSATSQELFLPASNLLTPHVEERWRGKSSSDAFVCDLGGLVLLDTIAVRGVTAGPNAIVRIRVGSADTSGVAGDLYDSSNGPAASFDGHYDAIVALLPAAVSGRYVRVDISDPDAAFVEAGLVFVCRRTEFKYNFAYGWQLQWVDRSTVQDSRGGQTLTWRSNRYRRLQFELRWVSVVQRHGIIEQVDRDNGIRDSVLVLLDTESSNLARDTIIGTVTNVSPVVQPDPVFDDEGPMFSKSYEIKERL